MDFTYKIPDTLPDRAYTFNITTVGVSGQTASKAFTFNVVTPVNLTPGMPESVITDTVSSITADTSKYVEATTVQLFTGTKYQTVPLNMMGTVNGETKKWTLVYEYPVTFLKAIIQHYLPQLRQTVISRQNRLHSACWL